MHIRAYINRHTYCNIYTYMHNTVIYIIYILYMYIYLNIHQILNSFLCTGFNISYPATSPHQVLLPADVRQPDTVLNCELAHNGNDSDISWVWLQDEVVLPDSNSTGSSTIIVIFNDEPETAEGLYSCVATLPDGNTTSADIQLTLEGIAYMYNYMCIILYLHCMYSEAEINIIILCNRTCIYIGSISCHWHRFQCNQ